MKMYLEIVSVLFSITTVISGREQCAQVPQIKFGLVTDGGFEVGDQRRIVCPSGFHYKVSGLLECSRAGYWTNPLGYCDGPSLNENCGWPDAIPNAIIGAGSNTVHSIRSVYCNDGFRMSGPTFITCWPTKKWSDPGICVPSEN